MQKEGIKYSGKFDMNMFCDGCHIASQLCSSAIIQQYSAREFHINRLAYISVKLACPSSGRRCYPQHFLDVDGMNSG